MCEYVDDQKSSKWKHTQEVDDCLSGGYFYIIMIILEKTLLMRILLAIN